MLHKFLIKRLRSKIKFGFDKKMYVIAAIVVSIIFSGFVPFFFDTDQLYTHLFYIPIAMSTLWMPRRTTIIGIGLSFYHIMLALIFGIAITYIIISRSAIIIVISIILNQKRKVELSYQTQIKTLCYDSTHDTMTKLYNKSFFNSTLESELSYPVTIIVIDIDRLKSINDKFGHTAGDEHIIGASTVLHNSLRHGDILARLGGDEFGIIAQSCDEIGASNIMFRIENQLSNYNSTAEPLRLLSISIGYSVNNGLENILETFQIADREMYKNKRQKYLIPDKFQ
nr:GGDEF domain-containing protein [uncultured Aminipila sp.]